MNQEKKISVCLPFYNIEPYVSRCLDSVLDNTYQNLEVICVNDGSTDGTSALLHKYAKEDPRVIVIDKENGGLVSARQAAISIATGDFLSFIDGDDWVHPQFFEILLTVQEKTGAEAVVCNYAACAEFAEPHEIEADKVPFQVADNLSLLNDWHARTHIWGRIYSRSYHPKQSYLAISIWERTRLSIYRFCAANRTLVWQECPKHSIFIFSVKIQSFILCRTRANLMLRFSLLNSMPPLRIPINMASFYMRF